MSHIMPQLCYNAPRIIKKHEVYIFLVSCLNIIHLKFKALQKIFYKEKCCVLGYRKKQRKTLRRIFVCSLGSVAIVTLMIELHPI